MYHIHFFLKQDRYLVICKKKATNWKKNKLKKFHISSSTRGVTILSLNIPPYRPSLSTYLLDSIQYSHSHDEYNLRVGKFWCVCRWNSMEERHLVVCPTYLSRLTWIVCEMTGNWCFIWYCFQDAAFLCSFHLAFNPDVEINVSCCLLQTMQNRFGLSRCIINVSLFINYLTYN